MYGVVRQRVALYGSAAFFSIVISLLTLLKTDVMNSDGICYLQSAATMHQGLHAAMHVCNQAVWPLYSILIFAVSYVTHWSNVTAAFVLNSLFALMTVMMFIAIVRASSTGVRIGWLAAIVILLASEFNTVRPDVIRDHGFWAFYLTSVYCYLQYCRRDQFSFALLWSASLIIAMLFRIEGALFLLLIPFAKLLDFKQSFLARIKSFFLLNLPVIIIFAALLFSQQQAMGRLAELQYQLMHGLGSLVDSFNTTANALAPHVLNVYSARDTKLILLILLCGWYVVSVIANLSPIYAVLVVYAWCKKLTNWDSATRLTVWAYVIVNVIVTAAFLVDHLFLARRYLIALSLVLMLWVPFALENLISQWKVRKWPLIVVVFFMAFYAAGGLFEWGHSKNHIRQAGDWLAVNAAPTASIYSNDLMVMYYSQHFGNAIFAKGKQSVDLSQLQHGNWKQYDYLALRMNNNERKNNQLIIDEMHLEPVVVFENSRHDQVQIYQIKK